MDLVVFLLGAILVVVGVVFIVVVVDFWVVLIEVVLMDFLFVFLYCGDFVCF